jgi:hypothetical protein
MVPANLRTLATVGRLVSEVSGEFTDFEQKVKKITKETRSRHVTQERRKKLLIWGSKSRVNGHEGSLGTWEVLTVPRLLAPFLRRDRRRLVNLCRPTARGGAGL